MRRWQIGAGVVLDEEDFTFSFTTAQGPGGQHVNRVQTAVQLRYSLSSGCLPPWVLVRVKHLGQRWLTAGGELLITASTHRSQSRNREEAIRKLVDLYKQAASRPRNRVRTRPPRAARERRLSAKKLRGRTKTMRRRPGRDE